MDTFGYNGTFSFESLVCQLILSAQPIYLFLHFVKPIRFTPRNSLPDALNLEPFSARSLNRRHQ
jgi:hypothetical protein